MREGTLTFVLEELAGDDGRHKHRLVDSQLCFLEVAEKLGHDRPAHKTSTHTYNSALHVLVASVVLVLCSNVIFLAKHYMVRTHSPESVDTHD